MANPPTALINAVVAGSRALHRLADAPKPAAARLADLVGGHAVTRLLATMAELRVADELGDESLTSSNLATRLGLDADALHRLLRAAAACGVVQMSQDGRVTLTSVGQCLREDAKDSLRDWVLYQVEESHLRGWGGLTESVRTGEPAFPRENGVSIWEWLAAHPAEEQLFAGSMRSLTDLTGPQIAQAYGWRPGSTVCDVAGGVGTMLSHILMQDPTLRGVLVDGPGPLAGAPEFLAGRGLEGRVELVEGDLFSGIDVVADVYVLKNVLHDWDDTHCHTILSHLAAAMRQGSRLLLVEFLQSPHSAHPMVPLVDLQMLTQTDGGRERSVAEFRALLTAAGLVLVRVRRGPMQAVLEAVAP
jgi:hypothetical protein